MFCMNLSSEQGQTACRHRCVSYLLYYTFILDLNIYNDIMIIYYISGYKEGSCSPSNSQWTI